MKIYILRHGETPWNRLKKLQGSTDISLNEKGIEYAELTREGFAREGLVFDHAFVSPLSRAKETADIILMHRGVPAVVDSGLTEMNFGTIEGMCIDDTQDRAHFPNAYACFYDTEKYVPEGKGETFEQVHERIRHFIQKQLVPLEEIAEHVLVVCHGGILRTFLSVAEHKDLKDFWNVYQPNCCVNVFEMKHGELNVLEVGKVYYEEPDQFKEKKQIIL